MQAVPLPAPGSPGDGYVSAAIGAKFFNVSRKAFVFGISYIRWVKVYKVSGKKVNYDAADLGVVKYLMGKGEISPEIFSRSKMAQDGT